jgi:peptidyl-tRNA hydrolase
MIIIKMEGNYPDISSGVIIFENANTGQKIRIKAPEDLRSGKYGIRSITLDTGAGATIFPASFAQRLGIGRPEGNHVGYYIFSGVGGTSLCFLIPRFGCY